MSKKNELDKKKLKQLEGHSLKTRRDFLSHGLMAGFGTVMMPSLFTILKSNSAYALDCTTATSVTGGIPVLIFDLAGGSNIAGSNVIVGKAGGQSDYLSAYDTLGLPSDMHPKNSGQVNTELGLNFHNDSAILRGIKSTSTTTTRAKVDGGVFCGFTNDDTQNNTLNPMYWLYQAGATGDITNLVGTENTESGGNSIAPPASVIATIKPVSVNTPTEALNLVTIGKLGTLFGTDKSSKIIKSIQNLSAHKINQFNSQSLPDQIKDLINCGYIQSEDALNKYSASAIDPTLDTNVTATFNNLTDGNQRKTATIAKLVLDGHFGVGTITLSGFDYHTDERATGEAKDLLVGDLVGRVLELAAKKGKNIIIWVYTDGGVASNGKIDSTTGGRGKLGWGGDNGLRSSSFFLFYRNAGKATLRTDGYRQIGSFKDNGTVDTNAMLVSNSPTNISKAFVANYLALSGKEGNLSTVVGDNPFSAAYDKYLIFNKSV
jgi:hypothetical protein